MTTAPQSSQRAIDASPFRARFGGAVSEVGERPELQWVKISRLRIDPRYQREIGRRGAENILAIATHFKWSKFGPAVIAPISGGLFAIVDGQHRCTAALLRGFDSVPCVIIVADEADQADAFVAINGNVSEAPPQQPSAPPAKMQEAKPSVMVSGAIKVRQADITRGGRSVKVSPRAALLVAALDRAKPNCVGDDFLIGKIWTQRPANARELLEDLIASLGSLKQIGLEIRTHRGIGRQLVETPL